MNFCRGLKKANRFADSLTTEMLKVRADSLAYYCSMYTKPQRDLEKNVLETICKL